MGNDLQGSEPRPETPGKARRPSNGRRPRSPGQRRAVVALAVAVVLLGAAVLRIVTGGPGRRPTPQHSPRPAPAESPSPSESPGAGPTPSPSPSPLPRPAAPVFPSGVAMPSGDLPGWQLVFSDDFGGTSLNHGAWGAYSGQPGGDPGGWWDPSHVRVHDGVLDLQSYRDPAFGNRWVSGGVSSAPGLSQTYGKYLVRFRIDPGHGISGIALLWPSNGGWPPEIDFAEDGGGDRSESTATLHYSSSDRQIQRSVRSDFSTWHTAGVEWTAGRLVYTLDGAAWATLESPHVPGTPMEMDIQTQAGTCGNAVTPCPDGSTPSHVNMQVDWVVAYRPA